MPKFYRRLVDIFHSYPFKYWGTLFYAEGRRRGSLKLFSSASVREGEFIASNVDKWIEFRKKLKEEWKRLWREKFDDKYKGEGVAIKNYPLLFVDRGTVIAATRNYKPPNFSEIVKGWAENFNVTSPSLILPLHPNVGGWRKFIKTYVNKSRSERKALYEDSSKPKQKLQLKKGGRGWLHGF